MVAQTRKGGNAPRKLKFNEKLVGKGLSTDVLIKKLKVLHTELAELDQDNVDTKSLSPVCKELISTSVLLHKDKGVKAYTACCLADLLRLFAPDAPYTAQELRDIFQFFFRQLSVGLTGSDAPYYNEYFHLLESLSTVKSVVLICDLPQADELMVHIFRDFFTLVRHNLAKNVEMFMADILIALIEEAQSLPSDVLDTIMTQFMDKNSRLDQPSYRLAVDVCNATAVRLQRHVCQYFTDIIVQHSQNDDFDEVHSAHELIKRLNHSCPSLLHNVVPQLDEELKVEEVQLRQMATQVLGEMFADTAGGELDKKYPTTWSLWLARRNDRSPAVRLAFVEGCKGLLLHHRAELRQAIEEVLEEKLYDPDEKVRAAVCRLYAHLDYETALHYVSESQLRAVGGRAMDKRQSVRLEAINSIAKLYSVAYPEIENNDAAAVNQFAWIPQQVFHAITTALEVKPVAEQAIAEYLLPLPSKDGDEVSWTDRLLTTMRFLDEKAKYTLINVSGVKTPRPTVFEKFIQCCIDNNGGVIDENEEVVKKRLTLAVRHISAFFLDPVKAAEDFQSFAKTNEQRLYKLLKTCMDPQTDLKGLVKATHEYSRRVEQSQAPIHSTMTSLLRQASLWIINQSSIPTLIKRLHSNERRGSSGGTIRKSQVDAQNAETLLTTISKHCPAMYRAHASELAKAIAVEAHPNSVVVCLQALAALVRWNPTLAPSDKRTTERLMKIALDSDPRHAKFATRTLAHMKNKEQLCTELVEYIAKRLPKTDPDLLVAHVAVLVEMTRFAPDVFEQRSETIIEFLVKKTMLAPCPPENTSMDADDAPEWAEDDALPVLAMAKVLAVKVVRHRCLVHAQTDTALELVTPVVRMLVSLLENGGSIGEDSQDSPTLKSRLRLQAAWSLVQLCTVEKYFEAIASHFLLIALTVQDSCYNVRIGFLSKLIGLLHARRLSPRFNLVLFLTAHDPEEDVKEKARNYVALTFRRATADVKLTHFETIFIRFLHLLAHHPDFGKEEEQIKDMAKYIKYYLGLVANADNVPLLYHLAARSKNVRDAESHTYSENLYVMSELAQELIKGHAKQHGWSINSYPGKVKLPQDIFRPLPNAEAANKILRTQYLPEDLLQALSEAAAKPISKDKPKAERKSATKRKATAKANGNAKRSRKSAKRKKADIDEDADGEDASDGRSDSEKSDRTAASSHRATSKAESDDDMSDENENEDGMEDLGRGARTRAKAKARRLAKRRVKAKSATPSDG